MSWFTDLFRVDKTSLKYLNKQKEKLIQLAKKKDIANKARGVAINFGTSTKAFRKKYAHLFEDGDLEIRYENDGYILSDDDTVIKYKNEIVFSGWFSFSKSIYYSSDHVRSYIPGEWEIQLENYYKKVEIMREARDKDELKKNFKIE